MGGVGVSNDDLLELLVLKPRDKGVEVVEEAEANGETGVIGEGAKIIPLDGFHSLCAFDGVIGVIGEELLFENGDGEVVADG